MTHTSTEQPEALRLAEIYEHGDTKYHLVAKELRRLHARVQELEASQAQRVPLSDADLRGIAAELGAASENFVKVVRATERAHGITQEKQG